MVDHYKILNVPFGTPKSEIKKQFRKLAAIHHPDKNGGSRKSEEIFKEILLSYSVLSDDGKRGIYDMNYCQNFGNYQEKKHYTNTSSPKGEERTHSNRKGVNLDKKVATEINFNKVFWIIFIIISFLFLIFKNTKTTTGNLKADKELENQSDLDRPESGEIRFKN